ncbi:hypothetical protein L1987_45012 [Smallanthus sonchifolius]|uniref:Uncharacterized protein n=1 Tax=Smallanthus sonchifolius TaxID=185202 RepID=A0ACB9GRP8_9ASTR|nr:hypothetical protein L1987_45012 [Smallanthus sonchifolius]
MSSRRRLRIVCSSDEEDDDIQEVQPPPQQHHIIESETLDLQGVTLNSFNSNPTNPPDSVQIEISDEEFIDAAEDLSNSPPPPPPPPTPPQDQTVYSSEWSTTSSVGNGMNQASDSPIGRILEDLGLRLRGEWLDSCLRGLQTAIPGFSSLDATKKAKLCFENFLHSDMNYCGAGLLPNNVHQMHLVHLPGPFVLQVDEIVNISQPLRERYKKSNSGLKRCLKLSMTDGVQRVFGMEYQPIKDLEALAPAGLKVAISNVNVRHGLLILVPEVFQVLGGLVEELDAARQRLVTEVNKPPRGNRTRTGVVPPLATRATRAAWPANDIHVSPLLNNPVSESTTPMQVDNQVPVNGSMSSNSAVPVNDRVSSNSAVPVNVRVSSNSSVPDNGSVSSNSAVPVNDRVSSNTAVLVNRRVSSNFAVPVNDRMSSNPAVPVHWEHVEEHQPPRTEVESSVSTHRMNTEPLSSTPTTENSVNMNMENASFTVPIIRESVETTPLRTREETIVSIHLASPVAFSDDENVHLEDRSSENPFTYLVNLSVKWAASKDKASHVEGKIKCFVTGVKEFLYKKRNTYKLQVYVDDGSLISEILIDHNIVQKKIAYSPEEINTALSSPDPSRVHDMKNIMKHFQDYLVNFEVHKPFLNLFGIMVVRINEASSLPVAIEMQQGCSLSDAWMLLGRLKPSNDDQRSQLDPIIISPHVLTFGEMIWIDNQKSSPPKETSPFTVKIATIIPVLLHCWSEFNSRHHPCSDENERYREERRPPSPSVCEHGIGASKAAVVSFYESLRMELGSEVEITIVTPGLTESEMSQGKVMNKDGEMVVDQDLRDAEMSIVPIETAATSALAIVDGACRGDAYLAEPWWIQTTRYWVAFFPEMVEWVNHWFLLAEPRASPMDAPGKKLFDVPGLRRLSQPSSMSSPEIKE